MHDTLPTLGGEEVALSEAIASSPFRPDIEKEFGKQYFVSMDLQKKLFCEANIPLRQQESRLTNEYQKIMATAEIPFDGKTLNLYGVQKYFEHPDRAMRAAAVRAYAKFYEDNEPRLEEIWDELIRIRNQMGKNLGYENYIPVGYLEQGRTDYGEKEVASFREQVRMFLVPLCQKLYDAQAKRLGIDHVMWHDEKMVFPDGNAEPAGDDAFMVKTAQKMYHEISPETGEFIDFMIDHELMDLQNKPGKASTGYMTSLPSLKAPFVFSCFNHTIFDMQVLTHELGHAFAGYMAMRSQPISDYYSESTDIAEIHSMSMEQFAYPYAEWFFGDQADKFRFAHLQEALTFVPFGVAVDEFQHICYAHPELTPKERTYQWHLLEEKYMPWRKYESNPVPGARRLLVPQAAHLSLPLLLHQLHAHHHGRDGVQEEVRRGQGCRMAGLPQALQDRRQPQLSRDAALRQSGQSVRGRLRRARLRLRGGNSAQADRGAGTEGVKIYNNDPAPLEGSFSVRR